MPAWQLRLVAMAASRSYHRPIPAAEAEICAAVTDRDLEVNANRRYARQSDR